MWGLAARRLGGYRRLAARKSRLGGVLGPDRWADSEKLRCGGSKRRALTCSEGFQARNRGLRGGGGEVGRDAGLETAFSPLKGGLLVASTSLALPPSFPSLFSLQYVFFNILLLLLIRMVQADP